jgi:phospholipid/cholesterol/gamma-HCH transport system substrate-binding protein
MYASRTTQLIVGIFGLVGIAALSVLAFTLGRIPLVSRAHQTFYALFENVSGLKVNDAVQIAGVKVGRVGTIALSQKNEQARVALNINNGVMVDTDAIASIKTSGIIGDKYVAISIGGGDPLKDGGTITNTESSFVLEDVLGNLFNSIGGKGGSNASSESSPAASPAAGNHKSDDSIAPPPGAGDSKGQNPSNTKGKK